MRGHTASKPHCSAPVRIVARLSGADEYCKSADLIRVRGRPTTLGAELQALKGQLPPPLPQPPPLPPRAPTSRPRLWLERRAQMDVRHRSMFAAGGWKVRFVMCHVEDCSMGPRKGGQLGDPRRRPCRTRGPPPVSGNAPGRSYARQTAYAANPRKSDRVIAEEIGVDHKTVGKARKAGGENFPN